LVLFLLVVKFSPTVASKDRSSNDTKIRAYKTIIKRKRHFYPITSQSECTHRRPSWSQWRCPSRTWRGSSWSHI